MNTAPYLLLATGTLAYVLVRKVFGYNDFEMFCESEDSEPFDGCKIEF
jgi:hypothetical protein